MQDLFSVHPDQELRATPSNWLDSATNSFAPLESQEGGLDVLLEEDEELDEYDIGAFISPFLLFRPTRFDIVSDAI